MNKIAQEARKRQAVVKLARRRGKTYASRIYGVSLSSVKRWSKRYDGTWQSLKEGTHRPHWHPRQHRPEENELIRKGLETSYFRYGWEGAYMSAVGLGYRRSYSGFIYAAKRMGLCGGATERKPPRKHERRYPELLHPGEKVQIDVKEVPYSCLRGRIRENGGHMYQWTAIDECTRIRFIYGFEEHTPENSVRFLKQLMQAFPFKIQTVQTDNGTEFTYKYISEAEECPFDTALREAGIAHILIPPRTPWHNGKVERSHRNDQRYFYDWEKFSDVKQLNEKLRGHLAWSNRKPMRTLGGLSPLQVLEKKQEEQRIGARI
jgi:transposase InsO family protein